MTAKWWLRAGLILLAVTETAVGVWQYFFPEPFYTNFPTVSLDPPFNEHLMSDVGGLTLAITAVLIYAAIHLDHRLVTGALTGFIVFAVTHVLFHATHLDGFTTSDAVEVLTVLTVDAIIPIVLLLVARRVRQSADPSPRRDPNLQVRR
jgi:H+/Cl- antiporter ClcA